MKMKKGILTLGLVALAWPALVSAETAMDQALRAASVDTSLNQEALKAGGSDPFTGGRSAGSVRGIASSPSKGGWWNQNLSGYQPPEGYKYWADTHVPICPTKRGTFRCTTTRRGVALAIGATILSTALAVATFGAPGIIVGLFVLLFGLTFADGYKGVFEQDEV